MYLTNRFLYAYNYSKSYATEENVIKHFRHIFVNCVPNPEICQNCEPYQNNTSFEDYLKNEPSVKMYSNSLNKLSSKVGESQKDLYDSYNRKIFNGSFQNVDQQKIVLAHHSLVVPSYLIEIEENTNVDDIVKETLYSVLKIGCYPKSNAVFKKDQNTSEEYSTGNKKSEFSFTMIAEEFKKEIKENHPAKIDFLIFRLVNHLRN